MKSINVSLILAGLILTPVTQATIIYVSGDVSGTWSADTVMVTAEVCVPPGQSLTILPGVEVLFQGYYKFIVDNSATLTATGTVTDSIRFDVFGPGTHWHGIRFLSASNSSRLEYCILKHGEASGSGEDAKGGAISCTNSSPIISHSTLQSNSATGYGGGIYCLNSSPTISDNTINSNSALFGGGIFCFTSNPTISGNTISYNSNGVGGCGGGIYCTGSNPAINSNVIRHNASGTGGGLYLLTPPADFQFNEISENSASGFGGGLYLDRINFTINKNTITGNTAFQGGGIFCNSTHPIVINSIFWNNTPQQIYPTGGSNPVVNYSDIQGSWTGTGNINADPLFVNAPQSDYHLQAGSPCIDTGDPNPAYNDPDGSRADMGCYYFDQGLTNPIAITITPINPPIQIPAPGGSFSFNVSIQNISTSQQTFDGWIMQILPDQTWQGPMLGPINLTLPPSFTLQRTRNQNVPGSAMPGAYTYVGYVGLYSTVKWDSSFFTYTKLASGDGAWVGNWENWGESFDPWMSNAATTVPSEFSFSEPYPNPFNPTTSISYQLPVASFVSLKVYDPAGRLVSTLINGQQPAGIHQVAWDASGMPSGLYFCRIEAGNFTDLAKMMLLK